MISNVWAQTGGIKMYGDKDGDGGAGGCTVLKGIKDGWCYIG